MRDDVRSILRSGDLPLRDRPCIEDLRYVAEADDGDRLATREIEQRPQAP